MRTLRHFLDLGLSAAMIALGRTRISGLFLQRNVNRAVCVRTNMNPLTTARPANKWCCLASVDAASDMVSVVKVAGYSASEMEAIQTVDDRIFDITESPGWMEYLERTENRINDDGGAGAYDTMRCDLRANIGSNSDRWKIWGQTFHLDRLQRSYQSLYREEDDRVAEETSLNRALQQSQSVMKALLAEAESAPTLCDAIDFGRQQHQRDDVEIRLIRLTLLWSRNISSGSGDIFVRGHACSTAQSMYIRSSATPIVVAIAAHRQKDGEDTTTINSEMPTRIHNSQCKIASWTRLRKRLEQPSAYKPPGVAEVLMVRAVDSDVELLEGLSSNVFVVYKNGTIRTAPDGVLFGYVRQLVLEATPTCGLTLDARPILLRDVNDWQEVFITSSTRLIYPVLRILIHAGKGQEFEEFWSVATESDGEAKWRKLLDEILCRNGYPRVC